MLTPMFPLEVAMLPGEALPLRIFEPRYAALVADCLAMTDPSFGVVLIEAGREVGGGDIRTDVGAVARIVEYTAAGPGRYRLRCVVGERIRVLRWHPDDPYPQAEVEPWPDEPGPPVADDRIAELEDSIVALYDRIAAARGAEPFGRSVLAGTDVVDDVGVRLYELAARVPMGQADRYAVLAAPSPAERLEALRDAVETVRAMVEFQLYS
ncbi:LON peptidase substrate-binding domain-containing protein [uncultured Mycolicibacterium sp.]|uniref:LON peptidase substrate-binding domain-containing protein n=1 Tax=uncultured Mycolicibacterium sp. TaxID=2320817 RepID=UPI0026311C32|nr:LON peptidase substrate-binding domain-containing protein [uncultured Mycolicibacterium sp.]